MGIGGFPHSAILPILPRDLQHVACYLMRMSHLWGFDLSMSAVRLMRREAGYWREIAAEKIDGPDIEDRLNTMIAQVPDEAAVHIFLPRDQILYTDVKISSEDDATDEIDTAMTGRTPYALDELEIDWEMTGDTTARVAAIARETLDEALAFAETRGLSVAQFSSFAEPEDFPRLPDFGDRLPDEDTAPEQAAPTFTTTRETPAIATSDASTPRAASDPVVVVDDDTPVIQVINPAGISTLTDLRLLPVAPSILIMFFLLNGVLSSGMLIDFLPERYCPVSEFLSASNCLGVPCETISPPCTPARGPISTIQSA